MTLREKFGRIFENKVFYIIFSLLASITIWLYVAYVENPDVTVSVSGISIELLNKDYLTDRSLVITAVKSDTVTLRLQGQRNTVSKLKNTNIKVTANLTEIKSTGAYTIPYTITYPMDINPSSLTVIGRSEDYLTITVDTLVKKDIKVNAVYNGGVADGYHAEPIEMSPGSISIAGPKEVLEKIDHVTVTIMRENISKTIDEELPFILYDNENREISTDNLVLSRKTVKVKIPVVMVKKVPLTVKLNPGAGADTANTLYTISPETVTLSGNADVLGNLNQIALGTIDLSQFLQTTSQTFKIALPNGTTNLTGSTEATVAVTVKGLESKRFSSSNIQVTNVTNGYTATIITTSADVLLRGTSAALSSVSADQLRINADLSSLGTTTGTFSVLANVYIDGSTGDIGAIGDTKITVMVLPQ